MTTAILVINGRYHILPSAPPKCPRRAVAPDVALCVACGWALERGRCEHAGCAGKRDDDADAS